MVEEIIIDERLKEKGVVRKRKPPQERISSPEKEPKREIEPKKEEAMGTVSPPNREEPIDEDEKEWLDIKRSFNAMKKEFSVVYGFCITRPGLPSSNFISYMIPHINKLEKIIEGLFYNQSQKDLVTFKIHIADFQQLSKEINQEIENIQPQLQIMDPFDKFVDKFIRVISDFLKFINNKTMESISRMKKRKDGNP